MKLLPKLVIILLCVSLIPVMISGYSLIGISQRELVEKIKDLHLSSAIHIAEDIGKDLSEIIRNLRLGIGYTNFEALTNEEKVGALRILYSQFSSLDIVTLLNEKGEEVVPSVYIDDPTLLNGPLRGHQAVSREELSRYAENIPLKAALQSGTAMGPVYTSGVRKTPLVTVALAFPVRNGKGLWVLSAEISLRDVQENISEFSIGSGGSAFLVDGEGRLIAHPDIARTLLREDLSGVSIVRNLVLEKKSGVETFAGNDGIEMIGARSPVKEFSWGVVVQQPRAEALFAVRQMRARIVFWLGISLIGTVIVGVVMARGISRPLVQCAQGALQISQGNYDQKIQVETRDEVAQLASSFNHMAGKLKESIERIEKQNEELRRWNLELEKRVEERTRELRETQEQLLHSQKMAAVGELGAGVAHELNNPLVGILGIAQLMLMKKKEDSEDYKHLASLEKEAKRCSSIVQNLLRFTQPEEGAFTRLDLNKLLDETILLIENQLTSRNISIKRSFSPTLPQVLGNASQLQQVFLNLVSNAKNAMTDGGEITFSTISDDAWLVKVSISDTGKGIPPENINRIFEPFFTTKDQWDAKGLGLSVAYGIIKDHKGKILVKSEVGKGSTFTVVLPVAPKTQLV